MVESTPTPFCPFVGRQGPASGFRLVRLDAGASAECHTDRAGRLCVGSAASNDLVVGDPTVSRRHCELFLEGGDVHVRDLGSTNGTRLDGVPVAQARARHGSVLQLGRASFRVEVGVRRMALPPSHRTELGPLVGRSPAMRAVFGVLERVAQTDATVLLEGETGTGKSEAALAIHCESARRCGPFVTVDCASIHGPLLESELFGHVRGAFTGAVTSRLGAFESARGGTVFIDEVGELPLEMQPKLLRVLENREIQPLGSSVSQRVDVRLIAATNRDLHAEVDAGRFRRDLLFRLDVVRVDVPPLRARPDDIPVLVERMLLDREIDPDLRASLLSPAFLAALTRCSWPGNIRELRNHLDRCLAFGEAVPVGKALREIVAPRVDATLPYTEARRRALERFERGYMEALVETHEGNVAKAAQTAGMNRTYAYKLLQRHAARSGR